METKDFIKIFSRINKLKKEILNCTDFVTLTIKKAELQLRERELNSIIFIYRK